MIVIGVIHLKPLPGSPLYDPQLDLDRVIESAVRDARSYEEGGVDAVILENYGDKPFLLEVGKETVACMTAVAKEVRDAIGCGMGVNVLRNDAVAALSIAKAVKADFVRVNQLYFPSKMPEGQAIGNAGSVMRFRRIINCNAMVFADICVKHAVHDVTLEDYILEAERSLADALIVTGRVTGGEVDIGDLKFVRKIAGIPVLAGSGVNDRNIRLIAKYCDGVIVGSYFKKHGRVDVERVRRFVEIVKNF